MENKFKKTQMTNLWRTVHVRTLVKQSPAGVISLKILVNNLIKWVL